MPHHTSVIWALRSVAWGNFSLQLVGVSVWQRHFLKSSLFTSVAHFLSFPCSWGKQQTGWEERGRGIRMTLELVELLGQSSLGGTSLAAAGFFSSRVYKINACTGGLGGCGGRQSDLGQVCALWCVIIIERLMHCCSLISLSRDKKKRSAVEMQHILDCLNPASHCCTGSYTHTYTPNTEKYPPFPFHSQPFHALLIGFSFVMHVL